MLSELFATTAPTVHDPHPRGRELLSLSLFNNQRTLPRTYHATKDSPALAVQICVTFFITPRNLKGHPSEMPPD